MDSIIGGFIELPDTIRYLSILVVGLVIATQINRAVYSLAYFCRPISPWSPPHPEAPPRHWTDRLPIVGWLGLRREASLYGARFWWRPLLIEILFPCVLLYLYILETDGGLYPRGVLDGITIHKQFLSHMVLLAFILTATLIDLDEKTIPDEITLSGSVLGLLIAAFLPQSALPADDRWLQLASPRAWPSSLDMVPGLALGLGALWFWCAAMMTPRRLWLRSGWLRAMQFLWAKLARDPYRYWIVTIAVVGSAGIIWAWSRGGLGWQSLLSALTGMLFGTLLVWSVRLAATRALHKEALGFGDVTLMAMIGAFLGWQPTMMIFFLAPFFAVGIALFNLLARGTREIPYGPYLSAATFGLILAWPLLWERWGLFFVLGWWIPAILLVCILLMWLMLAGYRRATE